MKCAVDLSLSLRHNLRFSPSKTNFLALVPTTHAIAGPQSKPARSATVPLDGSLTSTSMLAAAATASIAKRATRATWSLSCKLANFQRNLQKHRPVVTSQRPVNQLHSLRFKSLVSRALTATQLYITATATLF